MAPKRRPRRRVVVSYQRLPDATEWFETHVPRPVVVDEEAEARRRHEEYLKSIEDAPF